MPSEARTPERELLEILAPAREAYHSAVLSATETLRGLLRSRGPEGAAERLAGELGPFMAGRVDTERLARVLGSGPGTSSEAAPILERATARLAELAWTPEATFRVAVPPGGDLRDAVRDALAALGRAFGAARAAELARSGAYHAQEHDALLEEYPFRRWTAAERRLAPALLVRVQGADLRPAGLSDFLDGEMKLVLDVEGRSSAAPLARLVTPGLMVVQTTDADDLERVLEVEGPAVVALFDDDAGAVSFVHDPAVGNLPWERLEVAGDLDELRDRLEADDPRSRKDRAGREELAHLVALASGPAAVGRAGSGPVGPGGGGASAAADGDDAAGAPATDRLAAWLLASTDLDDA